MNGFLRILLLLLFLGNYCHAQDTTVTLTRNLLKSEAPQFFLIDFNTWLYKPGNDPTWSLKDTDVTGWRSLKPTELTPADADANGRVEGWFRFRFRLDSSMQTIPLGLRAGTWAAIDIYLNGRFIFSQGNTSADPDQFKGGKPFGILPTPVNLQANQDYTIALHFVDYISPFPGEKRLRSKDINPQSFLRLTGPGVESIVFELSRSFLFYSTFWTTSCAILAILFWLLAFQNPREKNLRLIALTTTFTTIATLMNMLSDTTSVSYLGYFWYNYIYNVFILLMCVCVPILLVKIFNRKFTRGLKIFLPVFFITCLMSVIFPLGVIGPYLYPSLTFVIMAICFYYVISSWRTLKGAQWAIVVGLLISITFGVLFVIMIGITQNTEFPFRNLYISAYTLAFPLSLLVYVAMRFQEIIGELRANADHVVRLSDEKQLQSELQQKLLEEEVANQTAELRTTLDNLKSTQSQLIQSEKMASLGELTAGIAHEIQNPLNFVNNFSELNKELIQEMKVEIDNNNFDEVKAIASDIESNEDKINHHGKRADAIVKGMLHHSRNSAGVKEPTDINELCDEYMRLSYHGLRAKDKSFNATIAMDFDHSIGLVNVIPQDIGRVVLNLLTNAFYAVNDRKKQSTTDFDPTVSISTKKLDDMVEIRVMDNGNGIPKNIIDKIFQPFFTSKPTGEGTGLGLSLSYDIITKSHGGELRVETQEGKGSTFIVQIPS